MIYIISVYLLGCVFTIWFDNNYFEEGDQDMEVVFLWFCHLPEMLLSFYQNRKAEKEDFKRRAKLWVDSLLEASQTSERENWGEEEWQRWNNKMKNSFQISIKRNVGKREK